MNTLTPLTPIPAGRLALQGRYKFPSRNAWGIPDIPPLALHATPAWLIPYTMQVRSRDTAGGAIHFFLDDYRFENVWTHPLKALRRVERYPYVLSPDFSLYRDMPRVVQLWNTYRNRWCGAFWAYQGIGVIPTVGWSDEDTFEFFCAGIARHSLVAVSTLGIAMTDRVQYQRFMRGFSEMVRHLDPCRVVCYGAAPEAAHRLVEIYTYPTRWKGIVTARRRSVRHPTDERCYALAPLGSQTSGAD